MTGTRPVGGVSAIAVHDRGRLERRSVVEQEGFQGLAEVLDEMEPIDHLHRLRCPPRMWSVPQALKSFGGDLGIAHRVLNVLVPQVVLDQPGIQALVRQGIATAMAEHVGMDVR